MDIWHNCTIAGSLNQTSLHGCFMRQKVSLYLRLEGEKLTYTADSLTANLCFNCVINHLVYFDDAVCND